MIWIDTELEKPASEWHIVFVTDGIHTCLARWINNPIEWYGPDLMEWDESKENYIQLDKEWHEPHWKFETGVGPFMGNDECFGWAGEVSHWMPLPLPPQSQS